MRPTPRTRLVLACVMAVQSGTILAEDLGTLLHRAEAVAPRLQAVTARAEAARSGVEVARSQYWGHAELFARDAHYDHERLVGPISYPPVLSRSLFDRNTFAYGAALTIPIDIDRRIGARVQAQEHLSQAASAEIAQTRLELFGQVATLYRGLQRLTGLRDALEQQLTALEEHRRVTRAAVEAGRTAEVELLRIKAEIKSVEGRIAGLDGQDARLRASLGALLNTERYDGPVDPLSDRPGGLPTGPEHDALMNRPDLRSLEDLERSDSANLKGARREWLPNLALHAETLHNTGYTADGSHSWSVTAQLSWQFWDGGRRTAHTDQARARLDDTRWRYRTTLNGARAEIRSAEAAWKAASLQYEAAQLGLTAARDTEQIQSDRFANGRLSAVDLLDAEAALARARADLSTALADWWLDDDRLHIARGETPSAYDMEPSHEDQ